MSDNKWAGGHKVALFIDVLNQSGLDIEWIVDTAMQRGELEMAWGYGRFYRYGHHLRRVVEQLRRMGIRLIHCPDVFCDQSDMTDLYMMRDIFHTLVQRPDVDCFVVCTGDGDFADVIATIRAHGRKAIVIGPPDATSRQLARVADQCLIAPLFSQGSQVPPSVGRQSCTREQNAGKNGRSRGREAMINPPSLRKPGT